MNLMRAERAFRDVRSLGPYLLIELLLPGGTLVALLLWLSKRYLGDGFGSVRQYLHGKGVFKPVLAAKPQVAKRKALCLCLRQIVFLDASPVGFRQRCEPTTFTLCCA